MLRYFLLILIWSVTITSALAQDAPGARAAALGGSGVILDDHWSVFHNQAGIAFRESISGGVFIENRFMIKELSDKGLAFCLPAGNGAFGVSFRSFGYTAFSSSRAGLSYALRFSPKFSGGIQVNYHAVRISEGYGAQQAITLEGGVLYKMNERITIGAHLFNPNRARLADYNDERLPTILRTGVSYRFSEKVMVLAELRKPGDRDPRISGGVEYHPVERVVIRAGFATQPNAFSFGAGWVFASWSVDVATGYHNVLGFSPQLSISYLGRSQKES